ncbi:MAG: multiheme c-type cytochrome [Planctomycetota bacterium]
MTSSALLRWSGVALLCAGPVVWWLVAAPGGGSGARSTPQQCGECHADVLAEWSRSGHAAAYTSDVLHAESIKFGGLGNCVACHVPQPMLQSEGTPPPARTDALAHGVDCTSCHALADGRVAAAVTRDDVPCRPLATPALRHADTCGRCHRAVHDDWSSQDESLRAKDCVDCHMPEIGRTGRTGRFHGQRPSRDAAALASAVKLTLDVKDGMLRAVIANTTAHNVPGERHFRLLDIEVEVKDAAGVVTYRDRVSIKGVTPFRGERKEDKIAPRSSVVYPWKLTEASGTARVRVLYRLYPHVPESEMTVIADQEIKF